MNWARILRIQNISGTIFRKTLEAVNIPFMNPSQTSVLWNGLQ